MATYTVRTCHFCGLRAPQPEMQSATIHVEVGSSRASASASTWYGAWIGNKRSQRAVANTLFNNGARKHYRAKQIWHCGATACVGLAKTASRRGTTTDRALGALLVVSVAGLIVTAIVNADEKQTAAGAIPADVAAGMALEAEDERSYAEYERSLEQQTPASPAMQSVVELPSGGLAAVGNEFRGASGKAKRDLQQALKRNGYYAGPVDGSWGPGTAAAFEAALVEMGRSGFQLDFSSRPAIHAIFDHIRYSQVHSGRP